MLKTSDPFLTEGFSDGISGASHDRDAPQFVTVTEEQLCYFCSQFLTIGKVALRWTIGGQTFYRHSADCPPSVKAMAKSA